MEAARQQGFVVAAEHGIAIDRSTTKMHAVVTLLERDELGTVWLTANTPVLAGQLECGFHRIRPARAEADARHVFLLQHVDDGGGQFFGARVRNTVKQLEVLQLIQLGHDGLFDLGAVVADVDVPQSGHAIHQFAALVIKYMTAFATHDTDGLALLHFIGVQHGVPETGLVVRHGIAPLKTVRGQSWPTKSDTSPGSACLFASITRWMARQDRGFY